jgi:peptidyl-prolyl cis-trans isomerase D
MLQFLRNSVASIFTKALIGLIMVSFAVWGMGDVFGGGFFGNTVAEVGSVKISANDVSNQYKRELDRLRRMNIDSNRARQLGIRDRVIQSMVNEASFDAEAVKLGLTASDATIAFEIRADPSFRGNLGSFDRIQFEQLLRANGFTEEAYVSSMRRQIARMQAVESITSTIQVPKSVADTIFNWREQSRSASITHVTIDPTAKVPEPTPTQLEAFHKKNEAAFTASERRSVTYLDLSAREFAKQIAPTEEELVAAFKERAEEFTIPEKRKVLQMVVSEKADAEKASVRLMAGDDFATVAKEIAEQTAESIELGEITREDIPEELAPAVFELKSGSISRPIQGPFGWHVFKVESITKSKEATLGDVRDQLAKELSHEKAVDQVFSAANKLEDAIGSGATFEIAGRNVGLTVKKLSTIDISGRDAKNNIIDGLPGAPFLETVFATDSGQASTLIEGQNGGFFILRVTGVTPSRTRPLSEVKKQAISMWKAEERINVAEAKAKKVANGLKLGQNLKEIREAEGESLTPVPFFTQQTGPAQSKLPYEVINRLFSLKKIGDVAVGRDGIRFVIAKLTAIKKPEPTKDFDTFRGLAQNLRNMMGGDLLQQYNSALRATHGVSINNALLDQVFTGDKR